jgi:hypothetical protein
MAKQDCGKFFAAFAITGRTEVGVKRVEVCEVDARGGGVSNAVHV